MQRVASVPVCRLLKTHTRATGVDWRRSMSCSPRPRCSSVLRFSFKFYYNCTNKPRKCYTVDESKTIQYNAKQYSAELIVPFWLAAGPVHILLFAYPVATFVTARHSKRMYIADYNVIIIAYRQPKHSSFSKKTTKMHSASQTINTNAVFLQMQLRIAFNDFCIVLVEMHIKFFIKKLS